MIVEPNINLLPEALSDFDNVELTTLGKAVQTADVIALLVDHTPFKQIDKKSIAGKKVLDTRGQLE